MPNGNDPQLERLCSSGPRLDRLSAGAVERMRVYRHARVLDQMAELDVPAVLAYDPLNIRYLTDARNMQVYAMNNDVRYVFVAQNGTTVLFDWANTGPFFAELPTVTEVRKAETWGFIAEGGDPVNPTVDRWADEITALVRQHGGDDLRLGVDRLHWRGVAALQARGVTLVDGQEALYRARAVKGPEEIDAIRHAIAACHDGLGRMREAVRPGATEVEVWALLHQANIEWDGEFINSRLVASGPRTNPWMQEAGLRRLERGDLLVCDTDLFGPYGYGADISRTWVAGAGPTDRQRRLYALAYEHVTHNIDLFRPGTSFDEITATNLRVPDAYLDQMFASFAHGIGLGNEWPIIMTNGKTEEKGGYGGGYDGVLEPGMVMCIESYIGEVRGPDGVKLEEQILVTDGTPEVLSTFPIEEDWL